METDCHVTIGDAKAALFQTDALAIESPWLFTSFEVNRECPLPDSIPQALAGDVVSGGIALLLTKPTVFDAIRVLEVPSSVRGNCNIIQGSARQRNGSVDEKAVERRLLRKVLKVPSIVRLQVPRQAGKVPLARTQCEEGTHASAS